MTFFTHIRWFWLAAAIGIGCSSRGQTVVLNYALTVQPVVLLTSGQSAPSDTSVAANPQYELDEAATQQVWAQAHIQINFASNIIFEHDNTDANSSNSVLIPTGVVNTNSGPIFSGNYFYSQAPFHPPFSVSTPVVNVFLVQSINNATNVEGFSNQGTVNGLGLGSDSPAGVGISMSSQAAIPNVQLIAHEIGHALGLYHPSDYLPGGTALSGSANFVDLTGADLTHNLMQSPVNGGLYAAVASQLFAPNANPTGDAQLTAAQIAQVQKSVYAAGSNPSGLLTTITPVNYTYPTAVPEPASSTVVAGLTVFLVAFWGVRHKRDTRRQGTLGSVATHE